MPLVSVGIDKYQNWIRCSRDRYELGTWSLQETTVTTPGSVALV